MTFCTLFDSSKALLPTGICLNVTETYRLSPEYSFDEDPDLPEDEKQTAKYLFAKDTFVPEEKIKKDLGFSEESDIIKRMFGKGIILKNTDTLRKINDATIKIVYLSPEYKEEGSIPEKLTAFSGRTGCCSPTVSCLAHAAASRTVRMVIYGVYFILH